MNRNINQFLKEPRNLFLLASLIFITISFFEIGKNDTLDIHLHDTYFIIAQYQIFWLFVILSIIWWLIYLVTNGFLFSKTLSWLHIIVTIALLLLLCFSVLFNEMFFLSLPNKWYNIDNWITLGAYSRITQVLGISFFLLSLGQILFVINLLLGLFKNFFSKTI